MTEADARKALTRVPSGMAAEMLGVTVQTLRNWRKRGLIEAERTRAGRMLWDVAGYMERESKAEARATS